MHFICLLFQNALRAKNSLHKYTTLNYFPNPHAEIFDFFIRETRRMEEKQILTHNIFAGCFSEAT